MIYYANERFVTFHDFYMMLTLEFLNLVLYTAAMFVS